MAINLITIDRKISELKRKIRELVGTENYCEIFYMKTF